MGTLPNVPPPVVRLAEAIAHAGGRAYLVGGWVRDQLLGREGSDLDLEVGGLTAEKLEQALASLGPAHRVGRAFPVFRLRIDGYHLDIAQPRADSRADGQAQVNPDLTPEESASRRDLRINAIALDPLSLEIIDPFDGRRDLEIGILQAVDESRFLDDPLRVLRVSRFVAQLGFHPHPGLMTCCQAADLSQVPPERVGLELSKTLLGEWPERGVQTTARMGLWSQLISGVEIEETGPEVQGLERLRSIRSRLGPESRALAVAQAVLLHRVPNQHLEATMDRLDIHRYEGLDMRSEISIAIGRHQALAESSNLSSLMWAAENGELAISLGLAMAMDPRESLTQAMEQAQAKGILHAPVLPLLMGRDLLELGVTPGAALGQLLQAIRAEQLDGRISTPEEARSLAIQRLSHLNH